jgi:hypothetical protein
MRINPILLTLCCRGCALTVAAQLRSLTARILQLEDERNLNGNELIKLLKHAAPQVRQVNIALSGKDTGGSEWSITHAPQPHLAAGFAQAVAEIAFSMGKPAFIQACVPPLTLNSC